MNESVKVNNYDEMSREIRNNIQSLKNEGIKVNIDDDQVDNLVNRILKGISKKDTSEKDTSEKDTSEKDTDLQEILNKFKDKKLSFTSKENTSWSIDAEPICNAAIKLNKGMITNNDFLMIFNPFSNNVDKMISRLGSNLGRNKKKCEKI